MKPVCVPCQRFYRPKKTGFWFIEGMPEGNDVQPGVGESEKWKPYKIWQGDLWECEGCNARIISGVAQQPLRIQHHSDFEQMAQQLNAHQFQVNDC